MHPEKPMNKAKLTTFFFALLVALFLPFPTRISNETTIQFLFSDGRPVGGMKVHQGWECFGLSGKGYEEKITDNTGTVRFPNRLGFGSILTRTIAPQLQKIFVHTSYGYSIRIEFTLEEPNRVLFASTAFKPLEPFSTSGSYLDPVGRDYFPQNSKEGQWVQIYWSDKLYTDPIQITIAPK